ncbi:MAG TPA: retropepsin-like aspartic protease [Candidatus Eremiobacteraceae bacterium]|nr:retropepsin-like aspartic protease [Candidatus Eremiobacteraceae bacterium]
MLDGPIALALAIRLISTVSPAPLPSAPSDLSLPTPSQLFERHSRAYGLLPVGNIKWSGTLTSGVTKAEYDVIADDKGHYREDSRLPLSDHAEGDDGSVYWQLDENGNVTAVPATSHHGAVSRLLRLNDYKFDVPGASVTGIVNIDGRQAYAVHTRVAGSDAVLYIDVASALVDGGDFGSRTVRYHAYKHFDGVPVPTQAVDSDGTTSTTTTVDDVRFAAPIKASAFVAPTQREPDMPAGVSRMTVPFDSMRGLIELECKIDGKPVKLLMDSGSSTSVIDSAAATRLGMPTGGVARINAASELDGTITRADTLSVGDATFHNFVMESVPLDLPRALAQDHIDGIIGYDVLAQLIARISYFDHKIQFSLPSAFKYSGTGAILPITIPNRVPLISAKLGRTGDPVSLTVDTGSDGALVLYRSFADAHPADFVMMNLDTGFDTDSTLTRGPDVVAAKGATVDTARGAGGGDIPIRVAEISRMDLGQFTMSNLFTQVVLRSTGAFAPTQSDGILGAAALSSFGAVFFDYPGKRVILEK